MGKKHDCRLKPKHIDNYVTFKWTTYILQLKTENVYIGGKN